MSKLDQMPFGYLNMDHVKQICQDLYGEKEGWSTEFESNVISVLDVYKMTKEMPVKRPRSGRNPRACPWRNEPPRSGQAKLVKFASATALAVGIY